MFRIQRFHSYLVGHHIELVTDHKPLLALPHDYQATSAQASARICLWSLLLSACGLLDTLHYSPLGMFPRRFNISDIQRVVYNFGNHMVAHMGPYYGLDLNVPILISVYYYLLLLLSFFSQTEAVQFKIFSSQSLMLTSRGLSCSSLQTFQAAIFNH